MADSFKLEVSGFDLIRMRLQEAHDFVEVGHALCATTGSVFGLVQVVIMLNAPDGRPMISVDNLPADFDEIRRVYFDHIWRVDPYLTELRTRHAFEQTNDEQFMKFSRELGYPGQDVFTLNLPITALPRTIGIIRCGSRTEYSEAQTRDLLSMSALVAVRLAQLNITPSSNADWSAGMTTRQLDTARLAAAGHPNYEIAEQLGISENTVKKHLKSVFAALRISNRTELAVRLARAGRRDQVAAGITRVSECCTVMKAPE